MLSAYVVPKVCESVTLEEVLLTVAAYGLVLCVPSNFSPEREFSCMGFPPDRIPADWKRANIVVKNSTTAKLEPPCAA